MNSNLKLNINSNLRNKVRNYFIITFADKIIFSICVTSDLDMGFSRISSSDKLFRLNKFKTSSMLDISLLLSVNISSLGKIGKFSVELTPLFDKDNFLHSTNEDRRSKKFPKLLESKLIS